MRCLAIIPARSGSKGLPDKNIKLLAGKPLMDYTIEAAMKAGCFDTIMVSTESEKYAEIARNCGAEVPFLRSEETSNDTASSWDAVREVLSMYKEFGREFDVFALLQPTTPLRNADDIISGFKLLEEKNAGAVVSVCEAEHSMSLYNTLPEDHSFVGFIRDPSKYARQMCETTYRLNGALYISKVEHFLSHSYIGDENCYATIMPSERSIDIDTITDFMMVEFLIKHMADQENFRLKRIEENKRHLSSYLGGNKFRLKNEAMNRIVGLDILRVVAMAFVVILHANGCALQTFGTAISGPTLFSYRLLEAIAYPAIHLFVLISAYFLCNQKFKLKRLLQLWINVFIVTFSGLIIFQVLSHSNVSIIGILKSIFPFTGQAYWFVSTYAVMILLSPFLNKLIVCLRDIQLYVLSGISMLITVILPTFSISFSFGGGNVQLFICLYLVAASIRRVDLLRVHAGIGYLVYIVCVILLIASSYCLELASNYVSFFSGKELHFYRYNSILVVLSAIGLFCAFLKTKIKNCFIERIASTMAKYCLFVYLIHMHPIVKDYYVEWGVLKWMNVNNGFIYSIEILTLVVGIFIIGEVIGFLCTQVSNNILKRLELKIGYKHIQAKVEGLFNADITCPVSKHNDLR